MSRITTICLLATMLALSVGYSAQAPSVGCSSAKVIAQKLADQFDQAVANQNLDQVLGFYDSSFVGTDAQGKRFGFAEVRKRTGEGFAVFRHMNPNTTIEDVQLEGGRMVVYSKGEMQYEYNYQGKYWQPQFHKASGETTWERKGGQWKIVSWTTSREQTYVDPKWVEEQKTIAINHYKTAQKVAESMGCPCR